MSGVYRSALTLCVFACLAGAARAQDTAGVRLNLTVKTIRQGTSGLEQKPTKATINAKKLFEICNTVPPTKKQGVIFASECDGNNDGLIAVYDKESGNGLQVATVTFDFANAVETTTGGGTVTKTLTLPCTLSFSCSGGLAFDASGIAELGLKDLNGGICVTSLKVKFTGNGDSAALGDFLVGYGSGLSSSGAAFIVPIP